MTHEADEQAQAWTQGAATSTRYFTWHFQVLSHEAGTASYRHCPQSWESGNLGI